MCFRNPFRTSVDLSKKDGRDILLTRGRKVANIALRRPDHSGEKSGYEDGHWPAPVDFNTDWTEV